MMSVKQLKANRENAKLSTGLTSAAGKLKVSGNQIARGILSNRLLLDDLQIELRPIGGLELSLLKRSQ